MFAPRGEELEKRTDDVCLLFEKKAREEAPAVLAALWTEITDGKKINLQIGQEVWVPLLRKKVILTMFTLSAISSLLTACVGSASAQDKFEGETAVARVAQTTSLTATPAPEIPTLESPVKILPTFTVEPSPTLMPSPTAKPSPTIEPSPTYSVEQLPELVSSEEMWFLAAHEIHTGRTDKKVVMMTYDDGGKESDIRGIMTIYEKYGAKTTFFVTGEWVEEHPELVTEMISRGFEVGCHGWDHSVMTQISSRKAEKQISDFLKTMELAVPGYQVKYIRFPFGARNDYVRAIAAEYGMQSVVWSGESGGTTERTFEYATRSMQPGEIVLSHSTRRYDIAETEKIIQYFQSQGYDLVTISEGMDPSDDYQRK